MIREECLNEGWCNTSEEAREAIKHWRNDYNGFRTHSSLDDLTPLAFAARAARNRWKVTLWE